MAVTRLSLSATPGRRYTFWPKSKGEGPFTGLSVTATPGKRHSFTPKTAADAVSKGAGPFTALSVMALPGMRQAFSAKTAYVEPTPETPEPTPQAVGGGMYIEPKYDWETALRLRQEDEEITEFIMTLVTSGILDN